jgi:hypothetical protein
MHRLLDAIQAGGVRSRQLKLSRKVGLEYRLGGDQRKQGRLTRRKEKDPTPAMGSGLCAGLVMQVHQPIATTDNNK